MKNKKLMLSVIGIIGLVVITIGVTYAFFNYAKQGTTENSVKTGTITFLYTEVDQVGAGISIEDALPTTDSVGKAQTGSGNVFNFKVTANTRGKAAIPYEVTARKKSTSTLEEEVVRIYLTEVDGTEKELLLDNYDNLTQTSKISSDVAVEKTIYTGKVTSNTTNYEKNFRLRMWLDNSVDFSSGSYNSKSFTLTVNVYANATVVTDSEVAEENNTTITSITTGEVELVPVEGETYQYEASLPEGTTSTVVEVETESPNARVDIERINSLESISTAKTYNVKKLATSKALDLIDGDNFFKVTVTSENNKIVDQYILKIIVGKLLKNQILSNNSLIIANPNLATSSSNTTDASGLYSSTATNSGNPTYYFRGNVNNNYVDFAGFIWRVVRINEDGTIRMVMSTGINNNAAYPYSNNSMEGYYSKSDAKNTLNTWYSSNLNTYDSKIAIADFCEELKVLWGTDSTIGNATPITFREYTSTFKCKKDGNGYGPLNLKIGLLSYDEVVHAGGYPIASNTSYYLYNGSSSRIITPDSSGFIGRVWRITSEYSISYSDSGNADSLRPVINLNSNVTVEGEGTTLKPYTIN